MNDGGASLFMSVFDESLAMKFTHVGWMDTQFLRSYQQKLGIMFSISLIVYIQ